MLYLNTSHLKDITPLWSEVINTIRNASIAAGNQDYHQPIKSYVRYKDPRNRIISMPAYVGGKMDVAGIKWIASFPGNIEQQLPRAHSVSILNNANNGVPVCIINSPLISGIRTAGVTGLILADYLDAYPQRTDLRVGILGMGPIGQLHLEMAQWLAGNRVAAYHLHDLKGIESDTIPAAIRPLTKIEDSWEPIVAGCDIVITCTVASSPYIQAVPLPGSIHLNVSLRDYHADFGDHVQLMIVDNWEEVCRENTNIEHMHQQKGLQKSDTCSIDEFVLNRPFTTLAPDSVSMFNPMGMAIFDIAVGKLYYETAIAQGIGVQLD